MAQSVDAGVAVAPLVTHRERLYWAAAGATILLGIVLRLWGYFQFELWYDEAFWARRILRSLTSPMRPVGYMYLSQVLMKLHNSEPMIRLPSLVAGIASLPLLLVICRRLRLGWPVTLLGLLVFAVHPWLVTASKEFKPYGLELGLHLALLALATSYWQTRQARYLVLLGCFGALAPVFAWTVAMLLPWLFLLLLVETLRARNKPHAAIAFVGGALSAASLAAIFFLRIAGTRRRHTEGRFTDKYDVFFAGDGWLEHARWLLQKTLDVAAFPAQLNPFFEPGSVARAALGWIHVAAAIAGCAYLIKKRSALAVIIAGTWLTAIVLVMAKVWPYGVFRTNLYLLAYSTLLVLCGLQYLADWASARAATRAVVLGLGAAYALLIFPYDLASAAQKTAGGDTAATRQSLEIIKAHEEAQPSKGKPLLLMDGLSCSPVGYYTADHASASAVLGDFVRRKMEAVCVGRGTTPLQRRIKRSLRRGFWLMVSKSVNIDTLLAYAKERCTPDVLQHLPGPSLLLHCPPRVSR